MMKSVFPQLKVYRTISPEDIVDFCGYPIELVKSVQDSMKAQEENFAIAN